MIGREWRVLVVDDEPAARRGVRQLLAAFPEFAVVGECRNGAEALAALDGLAPDVVFLDIQMPEIDGFEVIRRRTPERMPPVVFLTAYDQFAIRAFDAEAQDYLVKPVSEERFAVTMKRLRKRLDARSKSGTPREETIVVAATSGTTVLALADIDWVEAAGNYARLWVAGRSYLLRESLDQLEERMTRHGFARAHRRALVRINGVRALRPRGDGELVAVLASGAEVPISRRRRPAFAAAVRGRGVRVVSG